ncbi:6-phosphofructokinase [Larkinella insperata]|uniref:ATP-dependent 6-phosphofructokinase n=1 Tax=Larkinella insperata TaxID=332158 RepID=A0ABW3QG94_9BACT|nr:6-phosphofructokinase [Larkinella insperata]
MNRVAILTSGSDAPGMNACIRAVVRGAIHHGIEVVGIRRGYGGLIRGDIFPMTSHSVSNIIQRGGTILKSAHCPEFMTVEGRQKAYEHLVSNNVDGLVVIGGNGTFEGALHFHDEFRFPIVGIPGTIDNDLFGTDYTIGYDTAVNTALKAIDRIRDTADSHERIFLIEVMGRDSGYIAVQSGIAGGAEMVMVPEVLLSASDLVDALKKGWNRSKSSSIIIVAEGETKGTAAALADQIREQVDCQIDMRVTTLGHIQRGGVPSAYDRTLASRLGLGALEGLLEERTNVMVGVINNQLVYTPLHEAVGRPKPIRNELLRMVTILSV